jgi:hypothetical protein
MVDQAIRGRAFSNAVSLLKKETRFPRDVFSERWYDYLFFDPYSMWQPRFIDLKNLILSSERSSLLALVNLNHYSETQEAASTAIFLDERTSATDYISKLKGDGSPSSWLFLMDRYVCASDKGNWCIYCEKENDIAVFATGQELASSLRPQISDLLQAESIASLAIKKGGRLFDFNKLIPEWRSTLIAEYKL